jgi:putative holliday junction resolvase
MGMARALAIDLGSKRIGVAASDLTRTLASPLVVLQRLGSHAADHKAIANIVAEYDPDVIVVGLPLSLNGLESHAAALVRSEIREMEKVFSVPVVLHDERFTTATAHASMIERNMRREDRKHVVDKVAAAVLLQSWLDGEAYRRKAEQQLSGRGGNCAVSGTAPIEPGQIEPGQIEPGQSVEGAGSASISNSPGRHGATDREGAEIRAEIRSVTIDDFPPVAIYDKASRNRRPRSSKNQKDLRRTR